MLELVKGELTLLVQVLHRTDLTSLLNQSDRSEYWLPVSKSRTGLTGLSDQSDRLVANICFKCFNLQG